MNRYQQQWQIQGGAKKPYVVSLTTEGGWLCSCPAWTRTSPRKDCKHIKRVKGDKSVREVMDMATRIFSKPPAMPYISPFPIEQRQAFVVPKPVKVEVDVTVTADGGKPVRRKFVFDD